MSSLQIVIFRPKIKNNYPSRYLRIANLSQRPYRPFKTSPTLRIVFFFILLSGAFCVQILAKDFQQDIKGLDIGTYVEGTYMVGAQKKRFGGYINRTQGYAVTIVTNQLPRRRRITYQSINNVRVRNTKKVSVQFNPDARRFLARSGVAVGSRAMLGTSSETDSDFSGTIASVDDSIIVFATKHKNDESQTVTVSDLDLLSVKLGRTSYTKRGFKAGLVGGFCIGVIFSSSNANTATETGWATLANIVFSPKTVIFSLAGATGGSIIGRISSYDTWNSIPLDRLKFTPMPLQQANLGISATYAF